MTKAVNIGNRVIGGGNPILIQSMTNTKTEDVAATVAQIKALTAAGCDIIRCAVPTMEAAEALAEIKKQVTIPVVADIHFDYRLAIAAIEHGADKIRINPGNIGSAERVRAAAPAVAPAQRPPSTEGMRRLGVRQAAESGAPSAPAAGYAVGQRVEHPKFGPGTIERIETLAADHKLVIDFGRCGVKTLLAKFAKLTKL